MFSKFSENISLKEKELEKLEKIIIEEENFKEIKKAREKLEKFINPPEVEYIKRKALNVLYKCKVLKKIKKIIFDNLLLDIYDSLNEHLEDIYFIEIVLKYYYYEKIYENSEDLEVQEFFNEIENDENRATLLYYNSVYRFFNLDFSNKSILIGNELEYIVRDLEIGKKICENRPDIKIFLNLMKFIQSIFLRDIKGMEEEYNKSKENLKEYLMFSTKEKLNLEKDIIITLESMLNIEKLMKNEGIWLDYRQELYKVAYSFDNIFNKETEDDLRNSLSLADNKFIEKMLVKRYEKNLIKLVPKINYLINLNEEPIFKKIFTELLNEIQINEAKVDLNEWLEIIQKSFNILQKNNNSKIYQEAIVAILNDSTLTQNEKFNKVLEIIEENIEIKSGYNTGNALGDEILNNILSELQMVYSIKDKKKLVYYSKIISLILKFINHIGTTPKSYYKKFYHDYEGKLTEEDFQSELYSWFMKSDYATYFTLEKQACADGGRVDIIFDCDEVKLPIELKKTNNKNITKESIEKNYIAQAQTYTYLSDGVGIFILFDISKKDNTSIPNNLKDMVKIHSLDPYLLENNFPNVVISFIIPAGRFLPSEKSKYV